MSENTIIQQSLNLLDLAAPLMQTLSARIAKLYKDEEIKNLSKVIITGCGDSYVAGIAAQKAFAALSGLRVNTLYTIDATYHMTPKDVKGSKRDTLAVAVSVSGNAGGTVKAAINLGKLGAKTLALTENVNSYLAKNCGTILNLDPTPASITPGTKTYFVSVISLMMLALHIGLVNGHLSEEKAEKFKADVLDYVESFKGAVAGINDSVAAVAKVFKDAKHLEFVGSGIDFATAWFGRAKVYEAIGLPSTAENTEDWAHVNYFFRRPAENACVVLLSAGNPSNSRCLEDIDTMRIMGRPTMIVTDVDADYPENAFVVKIPSARVDYIAPLLQIIPITLLCGYLSDEMGIPFFRGGAEPWKSAGSIGYIEGEE